MESKFKVGEKVFSILSGTGTVTEVRGSGVYPVRVSYPKIEGLLDYAPDGKSAHADLYPEIYKDGDIHPLLGVPVRIPKQKVKKEITKYVNIYPKGFASSNQDFPMVIADTKEMAQNTANKSVALAIAVPVKIEFEVEE